MNKDTLTQRRDEARSRCQQLYDQVKTLNAQMKAAKVELERSRGDYRTYDQLVKEWVDEDSLSENIVKAEHNSKEAKKKEETNVR